MNIIIYSNLVHADDVLNTQYMVFQQTNNLNSNINWTYSVKAYLIWQREHLWNSGNEVSSNMRKMQLLNHNCKFYNNDHSSFVKIYAATVITTSPLLISVECWWYVRPWSLSLPTDTPTHLHTYVCDYIALFSLLANQCCNHYVWHLRQKR